MEEILPDRALRRGGHYGVAEVYYDEEGEIWSCSEQPVRQKVESLQDLREDLEDHGWALELPWLQYRNIVPDSPEDDELEIEVES